MGQQRVIYYTDEMNEEFSEFKTEPPYIGADYVYIRDSARDRFLGFFLYYIVFYPAAFFYSRMILGQKTVGRKLLRPYLKKGLFLYGNHTQPTGDAFMQTTLTFPSKNYVIVDPRNLKVPVVGHATPHLGALPLPSDMKAFRNFRNAVAQRVKEGHAVVIYPEAHIWPYYTKIRPFPDNSFGYPVSLDVPAFCFTNTYVKRLFGRKPRIVTYVDGPFFPDKNLDARAARQKLRDEVYAKMCERAGNSTVEYIKYIRKT